MSIRGIDVSEHNGALDWEKVKASGIRFAIIRAGYGRYAVDGQFAANIKGALAAGIPVGVYWFSYALSADLARQEAKKCLETIAGYDVRLPVFYDFEYDTIRYAQEQGVTLGRTEYNAFTQAFLSEIQSAGYSPGIYFNLDYYHTMVDHSLLGRYCVWYAQYASAPSFTDYAIWQYTSSGTISGLSGRFDFNDLKDTALLDPPETAAPGWHKDEQGWWYVRQDGTYPASCWEKIDGIWYYFGDDGYMAADRWILWKGLPYYLDPDGAMVSNRQLYLSGSGALLPAGNYYPLLGDVPEKYRSALEDLIIRGVLRGKGGAGDSLRLDLGEEAVRVLVVLQRALEQMGP